ncbi:alcohol dehydrogenase catalytic domain-containing protein [Rathayibacter sp. VKM Ac-2754]|nr:alcohol dehydrogenase catalytic domain-containing protein [Rathayibacter sp. VKM Ac-2754]
MGDVTPMPTACRVNRDLTLEIAEASPAPMGVAEVRVRPAYAGVCGSDLHAARTGAWIEYWPATLGHEVAAVVVDSSVETWVAGDRVVVDSRIPCRACADCAVSPRFCSHLTWLGESRPGGFATDLVVPATSLHAVPSGLPLDVAALAEPLAVVLRALDALPTGVERVLVQGYGPIGALAHRVLASRGVGVSVTEARQDRRELAAARGAEPLARVDAVIDAAGFPGSVLAAVKAVRRGGTVLVVALGPHSIDLVAQDLVEQGVQIATSLGFDDGDLPRALATLAADPEGFASVISTRIPLDELPAVLSGRADTLGKLVVACAPEESAA